MLEKTKEHFPLKWKMQSYGNLFQHRRKANENRFKVSYIPLLRVGSPFASQSVTLDEAESDKPRLESNDTVQKIQ